MSSFFIFSPVRKLISSHRNRIIICLSFDALSSPAEKIGTPSTVDSVANAANAGGDVAMKDAPAVAASAPKAAAQKKGPAGKRGGGGGMPITPVEGLSPYNNKLSSFMTTPAMKQGVRS